MVKSQTPPNETSPKAIATDNGKIFADAAKEWGLRERLHQLGLNISQARLAFEGLIAYHDGLDIDKRLSGAVDELLSAIDLECDKIEQMQERSGDSLLGVVPGLLKLALADRTDREWAFQAGNYLAILNYAADTLAPIRKELPPLWRKYMEKRGVEFSADGFPKRFDGVRDAFGG